MQSLDHASSRNPSGLDSIQPYSMHVSARYLELTKKKLELTRLPRELPTAAPIWAYGTPKNVLEPLLDYWLEQYDWRAQEASLNKRLPQFRCSLDSAELSPNLNDVGVRKTSTTSHQERVHFVHKRCQTAKAIPLLFCHGWPGSFLEASKVIDGLSEPYFAAVPPNTEPHLGFHVVVPSIPGFGFSDVPSDAEFGLEQTADCFNKIMLYLGYERYVAHGSGLGFVICRMLSLKYGNSCVAVHGISPHFPAPKLRRSYSAALKYKIARLTKARYRRLAFGYTPNEVLSVAQVRKDQQMRRASPHDVYAIRPYTRAFSLIDSPAALLGTILDLLRPHSLEIPSKPPPQSRPWKPAGTSSSRSPSTDNVRRTPGDPFMEPIRESIESGLSLLQLSRPAAPIWTPDDVLNWTMMIWLPGPEGGLRWLNRVAAESAVEPTAMVWTAYSSTPLGISTFRDPDILEDAEGLPKTQTSSPPPNTSGMLSWRHRLWQSTKPHSSGLKLRKRPTTATDNVTGQSPPNWAAAYQRLEWVRRHDAQVRMPVWEAADQVVMDIRGCFGAMRGRGLLRSVDKT